MNRLGQSQCSSTGKTGQAAVRLVTRNEEMGKCENSWENPHATVTHLYQVTITAYRSIAVYSFFFYHVIYEHIPNRLMRLRIGSGTGKPA
jgi:hypothetical protein